MQTEIVKLPDGQTIGAMAEMVYRSGFFGVKNAAEAGALLLIAQAEGKHPMKAIQEYDIVKGRPALKSSAVFGRFRQAGGKLQWLVSNDTCAKCRAEIDGSSIEIEWTIERAQKIGLVRAGSGWQNYPAAMLRARAQAEAVRALAPEVLSGMYCAEEAASFEDRPAVKAEPVRVEAEQSLSDGVVGEIMACGTIDELKAVYQKYQAKENLKLLTAACGSRKQELLEQAEMDQTAGAKDAEVVEPKEPEHV
jgi:hypothetical protein